MKYLVKTIKHTTGEEFTDIIKVKNNEDYVIVEAESKEEAEEIAKRPKGLLQVVPSSFNNNPKNSCWQGAICMVYLIYRKGDDLNGKLFT